MIIEFEPKGVCSRHYKIDIDENNDIINSLTVLGGCNGNLQGISRIVKGMKVEDVINAFEGINCNGKGTSCPDQISKALRTYLDNK